MRFASGSWKKFLFVVISGVSLLPASAVAEDARGKFTLARDVRWGAVVLPPGDYSYTVEHHAAGMITVRSLSGGPSVIVLASSVSMADSTATPRIMLKQRGDEWIVTSMVGGDGEELTSRLRSTRTRKQSGPQELPCFQVRRTRNAAGVRGRVHNVLRRHFESAGDIFSERCDAEKTE